MAFDQTRDDSMDDDLPHPFPFPSQDVDAAKAWLADPQNQDFSAWDQEKFSRSGKWPMLEALIAEVVGTTGTVVRQGVYAVCREEWGDMPMIKRLGPDTQNGIIRKYTRVLRNQCKKGWRSEIEPWISAALATWIGRAVCCWKKQDRTNTEKCKVKIRRVAAVDQPTTECAEIVAEEEPFNAELSNDAEELAGSGHCLNATATARPICKEYDEFVNYVVRNAEVHGKHDLELQPSWPGYKNDPFDSTAKKFRRAIKDRMIEDGILKQCTRVGAYRSLAGVQLDHSVRYEDYPERSICRWIEDYYSEGYGVTVKTAISNIMNHCQLSFHGPYVPPAYRPDSPPTPSNPNGIHHSSPLNLIMLATSDCGEYLDFINKIVRKALYFTFPQTIYEIDFQLSSEAFDHQRAEQLVGRVFRRMVKDNILEHTGNPILGGYDLCPNFEAKRFYLRRRKPQSVDTCSRLNTSSEQSLLRLEKFLDTDVDSISQEDFIRLYGSDAGSRYDLLQSEFLPQIKHEVIEDDEHTSDIKTNAPPALVEADKMEDQQPDDWKPTASLSNSKPTTSSIAKLSSAVAILRCPPSSITTTAALANISSAIAEVRQSYPDGKLGVDQETPWLAAFCEFRLPAASFDILPDESPYPSPEDMPSPMSEMDFSDEDVGVPELETEQGGEPAFSLPKPLDVKAIIQNKIKELERKRKLEKEAAQSPSSKRLHR